MESNIINEPEGLEGVRNNLQIQRYLYDLVVDLEAYVSDNQFNEDIDYNKFKTHREELDVYHASWNKINDADCDDSWSYIKNIVEKVADGKEISRKEAQEVSQIVNGNHPRYNIQT